MEEINPYSVKTARLLDAVLQGVDLLSTRPANFRRVNVHSRRVARPRQQGVDGRCNRKDSACRGNCLLCHLFGAASAWTVKPEDDPSMPDYNGNNVDFAAPIVELARFAKKNAADAFTQASGGRHLSEFTLYSAPGT